MCETLALLAAEQLLLSCSSTNKLKTRLIRSGTTNCSDFSCQVEFCEHRIKRLNIFGEFQVSLAYQSQLLLSFAATDRNLLVIGVTDPVALAVINRVLLLC